MPFSHRPLVPVPLWVALVSTLVGLACVGLACGGSSSVRTGGPADGATRGLERRSPATSGGLQYVAKAAPGARTLRIELSLPPGPARLLVVEEGAEAFVRDVEFVAAASAEGAGRGAAAPRRLLLHGDRWRMPACPQGCQVVYRFLLDEAAAAMDHVGYAAERQGTYLAPPSTWLLRPAPGGPDAEETRFRLRVEVPEGVQFASGLFRAAGAPDEYEATLSDLPRTPYAVFGAVERLQVPVRGGVIEVALLPGLLHVGLQEIRQWIEQAAGDVAGYFGAFPVPSALVIVLPSEGEHGGYSTALGNGGASVMARVGRSTSLHGLLRGWELTHEFVHLGFPNVHRRHSWLEEGIATYVEPIARARRGLIPVEKVWRDFALGFPKGLPEPGDRGLDHTPTWGRTYWGGALFCFLADVEIRRRTRNERSLDDALRAVLAAGGNVSVRWPIEQVIEVGDEATGVPVLAELYAQWKDRPVEPDLEALWRQLGVRLGERRVFFDEAAPLAGIRDAIVPRRAIAGGP
ncbi:hypothetical protein [Chondromyces crocatus]|uniref:hypothetical protein n=1 Tax=Chondromyces crocatus TaxID=52 RepID=UPI0012E27FBC|nr:hypothetical protein [Chondromyces crocatus]